MDDTSALITSWSLSLHDKATSTRKLYAEVLRGFSTALGERSVLSPPPGDDCQTYFAEMRDRGLAQATLRSRWIALRSFSAWATDEEITENPMLGVKVERAEPPPPDMPDDTELKLLFKACAGRGIWERRDLAMIRLGLATGARVSELCGLELRERRSGEPCHRHPPGQGQQEQKPGPGGHLGTTLHPAWPATVLIQPALRQQPLPNPTNTLRPTQRSCHEPRPRALNTHHRTLDTKRLRSALDSNSRSGNLRRSRTAT